MANPLVKCNFTREELEYISTVIIREQAMTKFLNKHLDGLDVVGVKVHFVPQPNLWGKLLSYIKKAANE